MHLVRLTLELAAPLGTPLAGPTMFGQLCWLRREKLGEASLVDWLGDPEVMWHVSDGFPHGFLPRPFVLPRPLTGDAVLKVKEIKKRTMVARDVWLSRRFDWDESELDPESQMRSEGGDPRRAAHNVIDRLRNGTLEEGGLFFLEEDWRFAVAENARIDFYVETSDEPTDVKNAFDELGDVGFGRDASTGRGRWRVVAAVEDRDLATGDGTRRMSLSRGLLTPETMADPLWKVIPHFGKAGAQVTGAGVSPFKRPVLLTRPGTSFRAIGPGPYGRWMTDVHPERPEIGINGLHVTVPFSEAVQ